MNKTYKENINAWEISTDASHIIHRIGGEDYPILRRAIVTDPEEWEEVAVEDISPYTTAEYNAKVAELIHERYDSDKGMSLINNMMEAEPTEAHKAEYRAYQAYREECKQRAKDPALYAKGTPDTVNEPETTEG